MNTLLNSINLIQCYHVISVVYIMVVTKMAEHEAVYLVNVYRSGEQHAHYTVMLVVVLYQYMCN